jgi:hypothetical protein
MTSLLPDGCPLFVYLDVGGVLRRRIEAAEDKMRDVARLKCTKSSIRPSVAWSLSIDLVSDVSVLEVMALKQKAMIRRRCGWLRCRTGTSY